MWGFPSVAQNSCRKIPRIHIRKKARNYSNTANYHAKLQIFELKNIKINKIKSR